MRGLLSANVPNISFAEAHSVLLPEPTHMDDEDEDQEDEKEDERHGEECKMEGRRESKQPLRSKDDVMRTNILSQCHVRHWFECGETRENVTCEGVPFAEPDGCSAKQVSLFLQLFFLSLVGFVWESLPPPATSEPNSFIQSCLKEIFGGDRGDAYTFSYMISPVPIMIAFGIQ